MPRWEVKWTSDDTVTNLDALGAEGWEPVAVAVYPQTDRYGEPAEAMTWVLLKRQLTPAPGDETPGK